jgi:hypothetical protein
MRFSIALAASLYFLGCSREHVRDTSLACPQVQESKKGDHGRYSLHTISAAGLPAAYIVDSESGKTWYVVMDRMLFAGGPETTAVASSISADVAAAYKNRQDSALDSELDAMRAETSATTVRSRGP